MPFLTHADDARAISLTGSYITDAANIPQTKDELSLYLGARRGNFVPCLTSGV